MKCRKYVLLTFNIVLTVMMKSERMTIVRLRPSLALKTVIRESQNPCQLNNGYCFRFSLNSLLLKSSLEGDKFCWLVILQYSTSSASLMYWGTVSGTPHTTAKTEHAWHPLTTHKVVTKPETSCSTPARSAPTKLPRKLLASRRPKRLVRSETSLVSAT